MSQYTSPITTPAEGRYKTPVTVITTPPLVEEQKSKTAFKEKDAHALEGALNWTRYRDPLQPSCDALPDQKRLERMGEQQADRMSADLRHEIAGKFEYKGQA